MQEGMTPKPPDFEQDFEFLIEAFPNIDKDFIKDGKYLTIYNN